MTNDEKIVLAFMRDNKAPKGGWTRSNLNGAMARKGHTVTPWLALDSLTETGALMRTRPGHAYRYEVSR